jgi:colanic acid biosynthesis protein WcaH
MSGFLSPELFGVVISSTPLIAIDLIVKSPGEQFLLGKRLNKPAQGFWFVPGGRIRKNETIEKAFFRICQEEIGLSFRFENARLLGVYEHFYSDNALAYVSGDPSTHYVVLGYLLDLSSELTLSLSNDQHSEFQWWSRLEILDSDLVHDYTKYYFK